MIVTKLLSSHRHQFVDNNLIIKTGVVDKRKVSSALSCFQRNFIELRSVEKFVKKFADRQTSKIQSKKNTPSPPTDKCRFR